MVISSYVLSIKLFGLNRAGGGGGGGVDGCMSMVLDIPFLKSVNVRYFAPPPGIAGINMKVCGLQYM